MADTADTPRRKRRITRWVLIVIASILALILLLLLSLRFAAQTSFGRNFVEKRIEAAEPSGQQIRIEGLKGDLLGKFRAGRLTVSDEQGVWLVAENVLVDWKPFALRKRALLIDDLEADLIHVMRRPILVSSEPKTQEQGSMPIRTGDLDKLVVRELRTDEGVLPRALSLQIDGQGQLGREGGTTRLSVTPLEGDGDRLSTDLKWSNDFRVTGDLDLEGPAGGLFASLAQLEEGEAIAAHLEAAGTLNDWAADGDIQISNQNALKLAANARGETVSFTLDAYPGRHPLTASLTEYLGDTLTLVGDLKRADGRPQLDLSVDAEKLTLSSQLTQTDTGAYSASLRLAADEPTRFTGRDEVSVEKAVVDGNLVYDAGTARFDGTVNATGVDTSSFNAAAVSGPVIAVYNAPSVSVRTTLTADRARLNGTAGKIAGPAPSVQTNAQFDLSTRILSVREFLAKGAAGQLSAAGTATLSSTPSANLAGSFQLDGARAGLSRPVKTRGQFELSRAGQNATRFSARVNASDYGDLPAPLGEWADQQALLNANGEIETNGRVRLSAISLTSGSLAANGSGVFSETGNVSAKLDLTAGAASVAGAELSGLTGRMDVTGPIDDLQFNASLNSPSLSRQEMQFSDVALTAGGHYGDGQLNADIKLNAQSPSGPLNAQTGLALDGSAWTLRDFTGSWEDLKAEANLSGDGGDLASLSGDASIRGDLPAGLPAQNIELDANIAGDQLAIDATLGQVAFGPTEADALVLRATGTPNDIDFVLEFDGRTDLNQLDYPTSLSIDGKLTGLTDELPINLVASVTGQFGDINLTTIEPVHYQRFDDGFIATTRMAALNGELQANVTTRGKTKLALQGQGMEIAPLLLVAGRPPLSGALDIDVDFTETEAGGLAGPLRAELLQVSRQGSELAPVDLFINGDLTPDLLKLSVKAQDNVSLEANATFDLPVTTTRTLPFIVRDAARKTPFNASADGQIEAISALFVPPQMVLQGLIDLQMSGELPNLNDTFAGSFKLADGVFEHGDLGMVLNRINAAADLGSGRLNLSQFDARGRSGGTLNGSGTMSIDGSGASDLELTAKNLVVTERREGRATVSGAMKLVQQPDLLEITGDLTVDSGSINIEKLPSGGPPTLDVSFEQPDEEEAPTEEKAATRLDIKLTAPGRINVEGRGVNAELGLDADITGTLGEPVITGEARIVRGRFDLVGKRFTFGDSTVELTRNISLSRLNISATHQTKDDITAILNVTGTAERPEVELTSNPELPDDEVLSRVLFGRSPSQLTTLETARLAAALAQLSGGGGMDLLGGIQQALGLDTFDVGSASGGGVEVTSGKYLTSNVYLEVRSGAAGAPGVAIEWEPIDNIQVEAATGAEDGQEFSIQWKKDFD